VYKNVIYFTLNGAVLGLTAGLSPGPLMTLLLAETLRGGWPAGVRVSVAPLVTDTVMVTVALLLAAPIPPWGLSVISVAGGAVIMWMGWGVMKGPAPAVATAAAGPEAGAGAGAGAAASGNPLGKAIATNLLNPNAFLFWLIAGGPILRDAFGKAGWTGPLSFMLPFFGVMISINLILAFSISRGRHLLGGAGYRWTLRAAGLMLAILGALRVWAGVSGLMVPR
jgi:threonine/homoserine/homoserine lactone efflux protein